MIDRFWTGIIALTAIATCLVIAGFLMYLPRRRTRRTAYLRDLNRRGFAATRAGDYAEAERIHLEVLARCRRSAIEDRLTALQAGIGLTRPRHALGKWREAEAGLRAIVAEHGPAVHPQRPWAWALQGKLASIQVDLGHRAQGLTTLREVLAECTERFGSDHPTTVGAQLEIGWKLLDTGQYDAAVTILTTTLAASPPEDQLSIRLFIARALLESGQLDQAETEFATVRDQLAESTGNGEDIERALDLRIGLARLAAARGEYETAERDLRAALTDAALRHGGDHPELLLHRYHLASILAAAGKPDEARAEHQAVLDARIRVLGPDHPDIAQSRAALG